LPAHLLALSAHRQPTVSNATTPSFTILKAKVVFPAVWGRSALNATLKKKNVSLALRAFREKKMAALSYPSFAEMGYTIRKKFATTETLRPVMAAEPIAESRRIMIVILKTNKARIFAFVANRQMLRLISPKSISIKST
jgi:hypothetical protein